MGMGWFKRGRGGGRSSDAAAAAAGEGTVDATAALAGAAGVSAFGGTLVALRLDTPLRLPGQPPAACVELIFSADGQVRRAPAAQARKGETAVIYHPGPYEADLAPFAAAPEIGLRTRYLVDAPDPRVEQQRFDLYLYSEVAQVLAVADFNSALEQALRGALALGTLDLPPCATLAEWQSFRAGLNQLLYTRFGVTVDDCIPVDLGATVDYAAQLLQRELVQVHEQAKALATATASALPPPIPSASSTSPAAPIAPATPPASAAPTAVWLPLPDAPNGSAAAELDTRALRRLLIELPAVSAGLRVMTWPSGTTLFTARNALLQRLALCTAEVETMPALSLAAPGQPLPLAQQARRARHTLAAESALDDAWALLARLGTGEATMHEQDWLTLLDEGDRLAANLARQLAARRVPDGGIDAEPAASERKEPVW